MIKGGDDHKIRFFELKNYRQVEKGYFSILFAVEVVRFDHENINEKMYLVSIQQILWFTTHWILVIFELLEHLWRDGIELVGLMALKHFRTFGEPVLLALSFSKSPSLHIMNNNWSIWHGNVFLLLLASPVDKRSASTSTKDH